MPNTTKAQNAQAAAAINEIMATTEVRVIDNPNGSGYAILTDVAGLDAVDVAADGTVHGALPRRTFLEPVNSGLLRLVRA